MYCKASATLAITSASRIKLMANLRVKTNWTANLPIRGQALVANPLQLPEIGDWHAACVESSRADPPGEHLGRRPVRGIRGIRGIPRPTPVARMPPRAPAA